MRLYVDVGDVETESECVRVVFVGEDVQVVVEPLDARVGHGVNRAEEVLARMVRFIVSTEVSKASKSLSKAARFADLSLQSVWSFRRTCRI